MKTMWANFQKPKRIESERDSLSDTYGRFIAEPFERGFGVTVGNALRRVLLSSLTGAAVTAVKIQGVYHEFSTISHTIFEGQITLMLPFISFFTTAKAVDPRRSTRQFRLSRSIPNNVTNDSEASRN